MEQKQTFKDFIESEEGIATNVLATKLKVLEELGMITKSKLPNNKKTNIYKLTEKGISLAPIIVELAYWSDTYLRELHPSIVDGEGMKLIRKDRVAFSQALERTIEPILPRMGVRKDSKQTY